MRTPIVVTMADDSPIFAGSKRTVKVTFTDKDGVAAIPDDASVKFLPPSGSSNQAIYAKNPTGDELNFDRFGANIAEVDFLFDEAGEWDIVATGATNMDETRAVKLYIDEVP